MATKDDARNALSQLDYFLGAWIEDSFNLLTRERSQFHYVLEQLDPHSVWYVQQNRRLSDSAGSRMFFGYDPLTKHLLQVILSVDGTLSTLRSKGWDGTSLVWRGEALVDGVKYLCRQTVTKTDSDSFQVTWEMQIPPPKGHGKWVRWIEETATRQSIQ